MQDAIKQYILDEFLPGEDPDELTATTPLITGGVLDSISTVRMVSHLESQYGVKFKASEMSPAHLDTLDRIVQTVMSKQS